MGENKETNRTCKDVAFPNEGGIVPLRALSGKYLLGKGVVLMNNEQEEGNNKKV